MPAPDTTVYDQLRRPLRDLRISITDRCNFRCSYCMPRDVFGPGYEFLHRQDLLTVQEISRIARIFHSLGTRKIRLTGGEPLLRPDAVELVSRIRAGVPEAELTLTTNGSRLAARARSLREAGLDRLTVSLDAIDDPTFQRMNDARFPVSRVLEGIRVAEAEGFASVKINCVVRRGVNEHSIRELAGLFASTPHVVRFIEYMDVGSTNGWTLAEVVPAAEIAARLESQGDLRPLPPRYVGEVARRYRTAGGGEIGIISSVTRPFCADCNRARLTADGRIFTCLFGTEGTDLRGPLRAGASDEELAAIVHGVWRQRGDRYSELRNPHAPRVAKVEMSAIGG